MATKKSTKPGLKDRLRGLRENRKTVKTMEDGNKTEQKELLVVMADIDPDNKGIVFEPDREKDGTAFRQQASPSEYWDQQAVMDYLRKHKPLYLRCTTRMFDPAKFEAEVAAGNIPAKVAKKLKVMGDPPAPFIRFGKADKESIQP